MKRTYRKSMGGLSDASEYNDAAVHDIGTEQPPIESANDLVKLNALMRTGLSWEEATKLFHLREHLYENVEARQRLTDDSRLHFARWLFEHGEMHEN